MSDGTFVDSVERVVKDGLIQTVVVDGVTYANKPLHDLRVAEPEPKPLLIHTLTGLVEYISRVFDGATRGAACHVVSHEEVRLLSPLAGRFHQRSIFAVAKFAPLLVEGTPFKFGQLLDAESFVVALQCLFERNADRDRILAVVGNIKEESVRTTGDDGVTQTVTAKAGVVLANNVEVPNPVVLQPYRTFREVAQPASQFVLRLKGGGPGGLPMAALFEADGGQWRLEAIHSIAAFLRSHLKDVVVIA